MDAIAPKARRALGSHLVGITVLPEDFQADGVDAVLDTLQSRAAPTAIVTSPCVVEPVSEGGIREPPIDGGQGGVRLLDRPLWGKREIMLRVAPSYRPDPNLYAGLAYKPAVPDSLTDRAGGDVQRFIAAAKRRGLLVLLQIQAAAPPGIRVQGGDILPDDVPLRPDGTPAPDRVDSNGSLASPHIRAFLRALVVDLCRAYPEIDGFRIDWPEYPPYTIDSALLDFSPPMLDAAKRIGVDAARMRRDASGFRDLVRLGLTDDMCRTAIADPSGAAADILRRYPGLADLFRLKAVVAAELVEECRAALDAAGYADRLLVPQSFPPPWTAVSGFDFARVGAVSDAIAVKLFTMHWAMMVANYARDIAAAAPAAESLLVRAIVRLLDISDGDGHGAIADYSYPPPDRPHPVGSNAQLRKLRAAARRAAPAPIHALVHGYGTHDDFCARLRVAVDAAPGPRVWINRYGYLSDQKLDSIGTIVRSALKKSTGEQTP